MRNFRVVYHEWLLRIYRENTRDNWDIPWYAMTTKRIAILFHALECTFPKTINGTYTRGA